MGAHVSKRPVFRAGVGIVVQNPIGMLLAGRRMNSAHDALAWQFPQGGLDNQPVTVAAERELLEEVGLPRHELGKQLVLPRTTSYILPAKWRTERDGVTIDGQTHHWVVYQYPHFTLPSLSRATDKEFSELAWLTPADMLEKCLPFRRPVYVEVFGMMEKAGLLDSHKRP